MSRRSISRAEKEAFLDAAISYVGDECFIWPWALDAYGYGKMKWDGEDLKAHREVCTRAHGAPPTPLHEAAHSCHNRACINSRHLRWATRRENELDKPDRPRGVGCSWAVLKEHEVATIYLSRLPQRELAELFGVGQQLVSLIRRGKRWAHLTNELRYLLPESVNR